MVNSVKRSLNIRLKRPQRAEFREHSLAVQGEHTVLVGLGQSYLIPVVPALIVSIIVSFQALTLFLVWVIGYSAAHLSCPFLKVLRNLDLSSVMMSPWAADKRLLDALIPIPELRFPLISSRLLSVAHVLGTPALSVSCGLMTFSLQTSPWRERDPPLRRPGF